VEAPATTPLKRRYVADSHDVEVVKKIKQNEVELRDRNTVLRGTKANVRNLPTNYLKIHN
jgi:parafibromin